MKLQIINRINRKQSTSELQFQSPCKQKEEMEHKKLIGNNKTTKSILIEDKMKENVYHEQKRQKIKDFFNDFTKSCVIQYQQTKYQMTNRNRKLQPLLLSLKNNQDRQTGIKNSQFGLRNKEKLKTIIKICSFTAKNNQLSSIQEANHYYRQLKGITKVRKFNSFMDLHSLSLQQNHNQRKPGFIMRRNMSMVKNERGSSSRANTCSQTTTIQQQILQEKQEKQLIRPKFSPKERIMYLKKQLNIINQLRRIPAEYKLKLS